MRSRLPLRGVLAEAHPRVDEARFAAVSVVGVPLKSCRNRDRLVVRSRQTAGASDDGVAAAALEDV